MKLQATTCARTFEVHLDDIHIGDVHFIWEQWKCWTWRIPGERWRGVCKTKEEAAQELLQNIVQNVPKEEIPLSIFPPNTP